MRIIPLDQLQQFAAVNLLSDPGAIGGPVIVPQCAQIGIVWAMDDAKEGHNVLYGRYSGAFNGSVAQANAILSTLIAGATWTALATFMPTATGLVRVSIRDVNTANQAIIASTGTGALGTSASAALPAEVAAVVTLRTALTGKSNRGRMYVPNWATNALATGNVIAPAAVTALQNWANAQIQAALSSQGYTLVIGQKARAAYTGTTGTPHPARPAGSVAVTSLTVRDNHWDSQRRRGLK